MKNINLFFSLFPALVFLLGAAVSYAYSHHNLCGAFTLEMPIMWLIMAAAHVTPWLMWWQQRKFQKFQTLPDKQQ